MASLLLTSPVQADELTDSLQQFYENELSVWATDPALVAAITSQNRTTAQYSQTQIDELDGAWRVEVGQTNTPTITPILDNPTSDMLRDRIAEYNGQITEIFVMDSVGLNVAASDITSDFWQGDEAKFTETYGRGPGSIHISDIELDESTQRYQGQISVTIVDPSNGLAVGAMTIGVDADSLM